jgi:hypothetical protein
MSVSLSWVMPDSYPLTGDLRWYVDHEGGPDACST